MKVSLFVTTFDTPAHLALVCAGLERQSAREYEILICDDGSGPETARLIEDFKKRSPVPVQHLWQENLGMRKCRILNEAARRAHGEVFIFLDGDCVPHRHYVRDHLDQQEEGFYLAGRRVELGEAASARITPERVRAGFLDFPRPELLMSAWRGETAAIEKGFRVPWKPVRRLLGMERVADMKGCNYSIPREALEALNGFDEEYEGYGREDTDVEIRLQNLGLKIKSLKGLAIQYHIWHPRQSWTQANDARLEETRRTGRVRCARGLNVESRV